MELSQQDKVVMSVIKTMHEMGLAVVSTATELGTGSIHIRGRRNNEIKMVVIVDRKGRAYYETWD